MRPFRGLRYQFEIAGDENDTYFSQLPDHDLGALCSFLNRISKCIPISTCVDVGANIGLATLLMSEIFPKATLFAFEPTQRAFEFLTKNVNHNLSPWRTERVRLHRTVIGRAPGSIVFADDPTSSAKSHIAVDGDGIEVPITSIDHFFQTGPKIDFFKIDAQGFEDHVLEGATASLFRHNPIVFLELNRYTITRHGRQDPASFIQKLMYFLGQLGVVDPLSGEVAALPSEPTKAVDYLNAIAKTDFDVFDLVNYAPLGLSDQTQTRPKRLDFQTFRDAYADSVARPYIPPPPNIGANATHYTELWESHRLRRALEPYDAVHGRRFRETAGVFGPFLESAKSIIELGCRSPFGVFARDTFNALYQSYENDLREPYELPRDAFDVVLCLEILQDMKDPEGAQIGLDPGGKDTWNYSGVLNVFHESFRVLRPGGMLLITTPNATSVDVLERVLFGHHPYMFDPHVRELAPRQVKALAELAGFELVTFGTFFAWSECSPTQRQKLSELISLLGFDADNRGDDAYFAFRRPANAGDIVSPPADRNIHVTRKSTALPEPLPIRTPTDSVLQQASASSPSLSRLARAYHYLFYSDRVEGWLHQTTALAMMELLWLQEEAGLGGNCAEIGVHHGCSTLAIIAAVHESETVYAIDIFDRQDLNVNESGHGNLEIFQEHLRYFFPDAHVAFVAKSSFEIRGAEKENNLINIRFFSIDGDHSKAATLNDLAIADACLAPHGVVSLDDVYNVQWTGVISALFQFLDQKHDLIPFAMFPNKLFLCRSAYAAFYQEKYRKIFELPRDKRQSELMNYFIDVHGDRWPHLTKRLAAREVAAAAAPIIDETEGKSLPIRRRLLGRPGDQTGILDFLLQMAEHENRRRDAVNMLLNLKLKDTQLTLEWIESQLDQLRSSMSWRITAPLRAPLVRRIRGMVSRQGDSDRTEACSDTPQTNPGSSASRGHRLEDSRATAPMHRNSGPADQSE